VAGYRRCETNGELTHMLINHGDDAYFLRTSVLHGIKNSRFYIMILIEKVRVIGLDLLDARETFHLTCRESDVVRCLLAGLTNKEIALSLGIEVNTVKDYIKNIMRKTKVTTRCGILSRVISCNTSSPSSSTYQCNNQ
jgi:DNA-binding NarL/FixJ family response regulator